MRPIALLRREMRRLRKDEEGRTTAFVVIMALAALLFAGLVLDGGLALADKVRAIGEAQEAARAGAQEIDLTAYRVDGTVQLVPQRASAAARNYLAAGGHTGIVSVAGNKVDVTVSINQSTQLLGLVGIGVITVTGTGQAEPQRGISGVSLGFTNPERVNGSAVGESWRRLDASVRPRFDRADSARRNLDWVVQGNRSLLPAGFC